MEMTGPTELTLKGKPGKEGVQQRRKKGGLALIRLFNNRKGRLLPHILDAVPEGSWDDFNINPNSEVQVCWDGLMCESHKSGCAVQVSSDTHTHILNKKKKNTYLHWHAPHFWERTGASD